MAAGIGKTGSLSLLPGVHTIVFCIGRQGHLAVVVNHNLIGTCVSFAWCHDVGTGIFKHRDEIRQNKTLREFVLNAFKKARTLPLPAV